MLTHRNLVANLASCDGDAPTRRGRRVIAVLPFFHIYGMMVLLNAACGRARTIVTLPRFDLEQFLRHRCRTTRITRAYVVPPIVLALAKHPPVERLRPLGAAHDHLAAPRRWARSWRAACAERLGVPRSAGLRHDRDWRPAPTSHPDGRRRQARLGRPAAARTPSAGWSTARPARTSAPGEDGRALVRGPQVMQGYLQPARGHRADGRRRRLAAHRRHRPRRRGRLLLRRRPGQGADQVQGLPGRPGRAGGGAARAPGGRRRGGRSACPDEEAGEMPKAFVVLRGAGAPRTSSWLRRRARRAVQEGPRRRVRRRRSPSRRPARSCAASWSTANAAPWCRRGRTDDRRAARRPAAERLRGARHGGRARPRSGDRQALAGAGAAAAA